MKTYQTIVAIIIALIVIATFFVLVSKRDEAVMVSMNKYEECVKREYGTTPTAWYLETGVYPVCDTK